MISVDMGQIRLLAPRVNDAYAAAFGAPSANEILAKYGIAASPLRVCHFFAQILEETGDFRALVEDLKYTVAQMMKVWPKRFPTPESAAPYAGNEEKLANHVYGNRKDLGNTMPGDGYLYRGRGLLQITGRDAYTRFGKLLGIDLVGNPSLAIDPAHCLEIAAAEYSSTSTVRNGKRLTCNDLADLDDITTITRLVNGGLTNLDQRKAELARCKQVWRPSASLARARAPATRSGGAVHSYAKRVETTQSVGAACKPYFKRRKAVLSPRAGEQPNSWKLTDLCQAYKWPTSAPGTGTIAIVELGGGYEKADIDAFCHELGIPSPIIEDVSVDPGAKNLPGRSRGRLDDPDVEVTMDIEVAAAAFTLATGKPAHIRVYWVENEPGRIAAAVRAATADGCDVCSISWGADEADWRAWDGGSDHYFADLEAAAQAAGRAGMTVFAASGDNDSSDGGSHAANVDLPSSAPSVIGCGGTTKYRDDEFVWNDKPGQSDGSGTGGGYSQETVPPPDWQVGVPPNPKGQTGRMVPDVAANADTRTAYQLYIHKSGCEYGGTSAVAPLYAGLFAALGNKLGFISSQLWQNGRECFVDITKGDNGDYQAAVGPDPCSGLGAPIGTALAKFVSELAPVVAPVSSGADPSLESGSSHAIATADIAEDAMESRAAPAFDSAEAVAFGRLINQAYNLYDDSTKTGSLTPPPRADFPKDYRLTAYVLMDDFVLTETGPKLYGIIAQNVSDPTRAVMALRGMQNLVELFDNLTSVMRVPFKSFTDCGTISYGFSRIYETLQIVEPPAAGAVRARAASRSLGHFGGFAAQVAAHVNGMGASASARAAAAGAPATPQVLDIAGHSLGGALATLYALENARTAQLKTSRLYTFASPRVGDARFVAAVNGLGLNSSRVVNLQDAVPKLPPECLGYRHIDIEKDIDSTGKVQPNEVCYHSLLTYLNLVDPTQALDGACAIGGAAAAAAFALGDRAAAAAPEQITLTGRSIYVFQLDKVLATVGSTAAMVEKAEKAKISNIWVKIAESATPSANVLHALGNQLHDLVDKCAAKKINVYGWHVPYCADASRTDAEVKLLTRLVADFKLAGVVIDNEDGAPFFKGNATTAAQYALGLRRAMEAAGKLVAMSSLDIISYHPAAYATVIGASVNVNAPQVYYGGSDVAHRLNWAIAENKVVHAPFYPVGVCVVEPHGEKEGAFSDAAACAAAAKEFIQLVNSSHKASPATFTGYGFWNWDQSTEEFWQVLYDADVFDAPSAAASAESASSAAVAAHVLASSRVVGETPSENCLIYEQANGHMSLREDGKFDLIGVGYSGSLSGGGRNDPSKQCEKDIGPLPRGRYTIGPPITGPSPYSLRLTPDPGNAMCGRSDFLIHGDSISHPGNASDGCIILSRPEREAIVKTGLHLLIVTDTMAVEA